MTVPIMCVLDLRFAMIGGTRGPASSAMLHCSEFRRSGPWVIKATFLDYSVTRDRVFSSSLHLRHFMIAVELMQRLHRLFNGEVSLQPPWTATVHPECDPAYLNDLCVIHTE